MLHRQRGVSLVAAIFVVVVVASLSAFAVSTTRATRASNDLQLLSDRALAAARAGAEWGAFRALSQATCSAAQPLTLTQGALAGFSVLVDCARTQPEGTYWVVDIVSEARRGNYGSPDFVYRRIVTRYDQP